MGEKFYGIVDFLEFIIFHSINRGMACAGCVGVDTNRNWPFEWGSEHASPNPCSNAYHGPAPETEPENTAVADWMRAQMVIPATAVV